MICKTDAKCIYIIVKHKYLIFINKSCPVSYDRKIKDAKDYRHYRKPNPTQSDWPILANPKS